MTLFTTQRTMVATAALAIALAASPASARKEITPYIEVDQTVAAQLKGGNEVLTYTTLAAGVDASVANARSEFQISYRYERNIAWDDPINENDIHSGLARGSYQVVPGLLTFEGGALATRARSDIRGSAPGILNPNSENITQVYSLYAGPTLSTQAGPLNVNAAYRLGYTKVESDERIALGAGQPLLDAYDDSITHLATASVGMGPGDLPFGWTIGGAYEREDTGQLDQRFESMGVRGDVTFPISPTVALVGGVGYEDIEISQRPALLDAGGVPILSGSGRFVTDKAAPRQIAYDMDGLYWDVGVSWRPSRRTDLEVRVGRRYGSMSYTGALSYQMNQNTALSIVAYDQVQTFGQQLNDNLSRLPTSFRPANGGLGSRYSGCTFGAGGEAAGGCLNGALGAINTAAYRSRGVSAALSGQHGLWSTGVGLGYEQRKYLAPAGTGFSVSGLKDETYYAQATLGRKLSSRSGVDANLYGSLYNPGIVGASNIFTTGAQAGYYHSFGRLSARASAGVDHYDNSVTPSEVNATAQVGLRYSF